MPSCNCSEVSESIEANPDVAGLGVVISFMLTALLTFCATLVGYISDSIPNTTLNRIDYLVVRRVRKLMLLSPLRDDLPQEDRDRRDTEAYRQAKCRRISTLERFVLALSDQQLVTGIAILIAGYVKPCSMDWYHFQIVAALAWFSSTTHLSTLALVRDYLINRPFIRTWRVAGMILMLVMLLAALFFQPLSNQENPSVYCTVKAFNLDLSPTSVVNLLGVIFFLLLSYGSNIVRLYSNDSNISFIDWVLYMVEDRLGRTLRVGPQRANQQTTTLSVASRKGAGKEHREKERDAHLSRRLQSCNASSSVRGDVRVKNFRMRIQAAIQTRFWISIYLMQEINESFLGKILWLTFGNAYGIIGIIQARWLFSPFFRVVGNEVEMGFGQIVPLLLLLLPLLAAGEAYYDLRPLPTDDAISICGDSSTLADDAKGTPLQEIAVMRDTASPSHEDSSVPTISTRPTSPVASDDFLAAPARTDTESGLRNISSMRELALPPADPQLTLCTRTLSQTSASTHISVSNEPFLQRHIPQVKDIDPYSLSLLKTHAVILIFTLIALYVCAAFALSGLFVTEMYFITVLLLFGFSTVFFLLRIVRLLTQVIMKKGGLGIENVRGGHS